MQDGDWIEACHWCRDLAISDIEIVAEGFPLIDHHGFIDRTVKAQRILECAEFRERILSKNDVHVEMVVSASGAIIGFARLNRSHPDLAGRPFSRNSVRCANNVNEVRCVLRLINIAVMEDGNGDEIRIGRTFDREL